MKKIIIAISTIILALSACQQTEKSVQQPLENCVVYEMNVRQYTPEGTLDTKFVNYYNEQNQMIRQDVYEGTVLDGINHYTYNSLGQLERTDYCDANDVLDRYRIHSYDDAGRKIELCMYRADGTLIEREVITYDENGRRLKQETFDADGNWIRSYEYE